MKDEIHIFDHLQEVFRTREAALNGQSGSPLHEFRKKSFDILNRSSFPDKKHEDWKYTSVQKLVAPKYKLTSLSPEIDLKNIEGLETYSITIINGKTDFKNIDAGLYQQGIKLVSLQDAFEDETWRESFLRLISSSTPDTNRAFDFLNFSFQSGGFFLHIPKNVQVDKVIEIRILHDDPDVSFSHPLYFIHCETGSDVKFIERFERNQSHEVLSPESFINSLGFINLEKNASVSYIKWQNIPAAQHLVYKLFVTQYRDSRFDMFAFDKGGSLVRNNIEIELEENNTYTSLQAGYIASAKQSMDHQTRINHKVAYCESHELYKGIIDGQATAAFNGKVLVHKDAQKTNAYQQNDTLVISPHALMNSKPQLEIFADDVKCSHGATIGQLDAQSIFYLKSRGIDEATSKQILKEAFLAEVIEKISDIHVREFIKSQMTLAS
jgi:Fe-S cluster assembly protein SufD